MGLVSIGGSGRIELLPQECLFLQSISVTAFHRAETIASSPSVTADPTYRTLGSRERLANERASLQHLQIRREAAIKEYFALTPAEWRVASALYKGESLQGLAALHKMSVNTLRVQLASVYAKTGTHRQTELVAAIRSAIDAQGDFAD